jgi:N utilization substance protein A
VDIRSETEFAAEEAEHGYEEEEVQGRCAAILSNGRRCPNAALPGSRYCGLEVHQALAGIEGDNVVDLAPEGSAGEPGPEVDETAVEPAAVEVGEAAVEPGPEAEDAAAAPGPEIEPVAVEPDSEVEDLPQEAFAETSHETAEEQAT